MHFRTIPPRLRPRRGLLFGQGLAAYGVVVVGGLLVGFSIPRPKWAGGAEPAAGAPSMEETPARAPIGAAEAELLAQGTPDLEPAPPALDGAESPELHALRSAEKRIFGSSSPRTPASMPDPDVCRDPAMCSDNGEQGDAWKNGLRMPDLPVRSDAKIARFLHYFVDDPQGRKIFRSWLKRSGRYRGVVETALRERALPRDLEALVFIESGFSPAAVSSAGAVGLWQFMPETARTYGLSVEADFDERRSIGRASDAGARHLSDLYEKFGSWELALAAYDMGYKGMLDRVRDTGSNDYWTLSKLQGALPREAVLYVPKVLAVAIILNNLDRFGFGDTHVEAPIATANLEVPAGTDLALVARAAGTSVQRLRELNPELLGDIIPDRGRTFIAHVPTGGLARAHAMLPRLLDRRDRDGLEREVGRRFDWGRDEIPRDRPYARSEGDDFLDPPRAPRTAQAPLWNGDGDGPDARQRSVFYRVGDKETLDDVARMFGVNKEEIIEANYLDPNARLQKGMLLSLNVRADVMAKIAKKRAAERLEKQEARELDDEADAAPKADAMQGFAMSRQTRPDASVRPAHRPTPEGAKRAPVQRESK